MGPLRLAPGASGRAAPGSPSRVGRHVGAGLFKDLPPDGILCRLALANSAIAFRTAGHLAAYAGLAPVTRRSSTSIRGEFPARSGNKHLKRAQGKKHNAALICLARRRCDVLHAMLSTASHYQPPATEPVPAA